ncbi:translation initiation factor IF-2 [Candidatus Bathyarchaeota archaeon]|nr:MAG: translation initiation factor IF-2 [archaeon 13_1_20CM_2_51_12]TMI39554.1 MAG: translation initiation factor IF-2 [Candidatus Bathyarchaeota archaeon]
MPIRQPIAVVLGHVDHGKTTLLDRLRGTSVAAREPGQITQWIGASLIPAKTLTEIIGPLLARFKLTIEVPGILFIDTPGHETFSNLRKRGGSAADVAVLVIDVTKGIEPQTVESLTILKARKTPFLICCNKIDAVPGWKSSGAGSFLENMASQRPEVLTDLDNRLYSMMGTLSRYGIRADRFDRITEFAKTVALVPASAKTGEGIPELMAVLVGLTQVYMKGELSVTSGPAEGTVLEVKEEPGLGVTIDAMIYNGRLEVDDQIMVAGRNGVIGTRVRALLLPKPLDEIRDPRDKFSNAKSVDAAAGIKIAAAGLEDAIAGSSLYGVKDASSRKAIKERILSEVEEVRVKKDLSGVVVKSDALGSLEALTTSLEASKIPVRLADVGDVSRRDVVEAKAVHAKDPYLGVVLAFGVKLLPDAEEEIALSKIPVFKGDVLYHVLEEYSRWVEAQRLAGAKAEMDLLIRPGKIKLLKGFVFRRSDPAIVGVEVVDGIIKPKYPLINIRGQRIGQVVRIQDQGKDVGEAGAGKQVAVSIDKPMVGRQINEGDVLYVDVPVQHARVLSSKFKDYLTPRELALLSEMATLTTGGTSGAVA